MYKNIFGQHDEKFIKLEKNVKIAFCPNNKNII